MLTFTINDNDSGQRVDKFISKSMPDLPKSMMYKLIRKKDIRVNGKRCSISDRLSTGDTVTVYVKQELSQEKVHDMSFLKAPEVLDIVYEDSNIIIVNKPCGLDSHSNGSNTEDTLINRIKHCLYTKNEYIPQDENSFAPALCSRLDRNTQGLVTCAKNALALREVNSAIKNGFLHKIYHCITISPPPESSDIITGFLKKEANRNIVKISDTMIEGYKPIKTGYKVIGRNNGLCLLEVTLFTGRTHQIRSHLAHIGCAVLGDGKYGNTAVNKKYKVFGQALCACSLKFDLPADSPLSYLNDVSISTREPDSFRSIMS